LDLDHVPVVFHILDDVTARDIAAPVENHTDWERNRGLDSDLISPRVQIDVVEEAEKGANNFTAFTALAYRLSTHKLTFGTKQRAIGPRSSPAAQ
jgi:hypothetical protein